MFFLILLFTILVSDPANAQTGLPIPRFVSLRSNQVNLRTGPGTKYPVEWVYLKSDLPVEITEEFETWRRIKDSEGREGWIFQSMLSGRRTVRVTRDALLLRAANVNALPLAKVEKGAVGKLTACPDGIRLCKVDFGSFQGWLPRESLWGVYRDEIFE